MNALRSLPSTLCMAASLFALGACKTLDGLTNNLGKLQAPAFTRGDQLSEEFLLRDNCPGVSIVTELGILNDFGNTILITPDDLVTHNSMTGGKGQCAYAPKSFSIDLDLAFESALGPQGITGETYEYPFFVAVKDERGDIVAKEVFSVPLTFKVGHNTTAHYEKIRQIIPLPSPSQGRKYKILAGFQLSKEQLAYNRAYIQALRERAASEKAAQEEAEEVLENPPDPMRPSSGASENSPPPPPPRMAPMNDFQPVPLIPPS